MPSGKPKLAPISKKTEPKPSSTRITVGKHVANIFIDSSKYTTMHHWIVQHLGSAEIIAWGQEPTFDRAKSAARDCLNDLAHKP